MHQILSSIQYIENVFTVFQVIFLIQLNASVVDMLKNQKNLHIKCIQKQNHLRYYTKNIVFVSFFRLNIKI